MLPSDGQKKRKILKKSKKPNSIHKWYIRRVYNMNMRRLFQEKLAEMREYDKTHTRREVWEKFAKQYQMRLYTFYKWAETYFGKKDMKFSLKISKAKHSRRVLFPEHKSTRLERELQDMEIDRDKWKKVAESFEPVKRKLMAQSGYFFLKHKVSSTVESEQNFINESIRAYSELQKGETQNGI